MLNPCKPCICPGAPCEQCSFGYRSEEENHEKLKKLLLAVNAGEKTSGWKHAEFYMQFHANWREELGLAETKEKEKKPMSYEYKGPAKEPLILEPEDWSEAEWATILKLFGMEEADRIKVSDYVLETYGITKKG
jgi:hypothetical protein